MVTHFPLLVLLSFIPHVKQLQSIVYKFKTIVCCTVAVPTITSTKFSILIIFLNPFPLPHISKTPI